jgi:hypothetical protein
MELRLQSSFAVARYYWVMCSWYRTRELASLKVLCVAGLT